MGGEPALAPLEGIRYARQITTTTTILIRVVGLRTQSLNSETRTATPDNQARSMLGTHMGTACQDSETGTATPDNQARSRLGHTHSLATTIAATHPQ